MRKQKILIADDSRMNLMLAGRMLWGAGFLVEETLTGGEALESLKTHIPDLLIADMTLPDMNGYELIAKIREDPMTARLPVILTSLGGSSEMEIKCFRAGAVDFIAKPFTPEVLLQRVRRTMELERYRRNLEDMVQEQLAQITHLQRNIIISMANLIDSRDGTTGGHVRRTSDYMAYITRRMKDKGMYPELLTPTYMDWMCKAAPLHDIGKLSITDLILQKPARLTQEEYEIMKNHSAEGGRLIQINMQGLVEDEFVQLASDMAAYHHERMDGTGYPAGLKGEEIPFPARVMAVIDVYDALTSNRQYKDAMSFDEAAQILRDMRGSSLQSDLVDVLLEDKDRLWALTTSLRGLD